MKPENAYRMQKKLRTAGKYALCSLIALMMLAPFYWMVTTSLKAYAKVLLFPPQLWPDPVVWQNYVDLFSMQPFLLYMYNSIYIALVVSAGVIAFSTLAGYAFAKIRFPGSNLLFMVVLSGMMMPVEITTIPLFLALSPIGLAQSHFPLIVPQIFGYCGAFGTFLMRQFFLTVPDELMEAAKIDGCGQPRIYARIMMPMATTSVATLLIFTFLQNWNEFFLPLIYLSSSKLYTIPLALALFTTENGVQWHLIMAAATVSTLPVLIVFFLAQRKFIESLSMTGIK